MYISGLGLQWLVSVFEIWYGFRLVLYLTDLTDSIKLWGNILRWAGIIVFGSLLAFNRTIAFFSFGMFVLQIIFSILCMLCIVRRKPAFISCVIITYYTMVALQDFAFAFIGMIYDSSSFEQIIYFGDSIWKSIIYFTSRLFVSLLIGVLLRKKDLSGDVLGAYWKPFLAFDLFLLFVLRTYQTFIIVLLNDKGQYIEIMTKEILASLIFLLAMAYVTAFLFLKNSYTANQNNFLLLQEKLLKEKYKEVAAEIENQHKVVHDVKHHLLVLQGLLKEKEIQRMDAYLADVEKEFTVSEMKKWTENEIVNLILNQKIVSAQKAGISFRIDIEERVAIPVSDSENCAIFGNLLDNAIEACERIESGEKWIHVKMRRQGRMFMLEVANSTETFPQKVNGKWTSSKQEGQMHGYGLKSVEDIVKRHKGIVSYKTGAGKFAVIITLFD